MVGFYDSIQICFELQNTPCLQRGIFVVIVLNTQSMFCIDLMWFISFGFYL